MENSCGGVTGLYRKDFNYRYVRTSQVDVIVVVELYWLIAELCSVLTRCNNCLVKLLLSFFTDGGKKRILHVHTIHVYYLKFEVGNIGLWFQ